MFNHGKNAILLLYTVLTRGSDFWGKIWSWIFY